MNLAFSPLQLRCLDGLGYTLYALVGTQPSIQSRNLPIEAPAPPGMLRANRPGSSKPAPSEAPARTDARDQRLLLAVLKAARTRPDAIGDTQGWLAARGVASIEALRNHPAAKRALWATLRRERRTP